MIIIIGFDGLDPYIVDEFGLSGLKQQCHAYLDIPEDVCLHTEVIWPTIITGVKPDMHGLTLTNARTWKNPVLQFIARTAVSLLPEKILLPIGKKIQLLGFERRSKGNPEYYERRGLKTIFSDTRAKVIGVPGYAPAQKTDQLRKLGGHSTYVPIVEIDQLIAELEKEFKEREEALLEGIKLPVNILMVYFFCLDMIGHFFWDNKEFMQSWYRKCEDLVQLVRTKMSSEDILIVISDHGMQKGKHAGKAFFSCSLPLDRNKIPASIMGIKPLVEQLLSKTKDGHESVRKHLQDLGYI